MRWKEDCAAPVFQMDVGNACFEHYFSYQVFKYFQNSKYFLISSQDGRKTVLNKPRKWDGPVLKNYFNYRLGRLE